MCPEQRRSAGALALLGVCLCGAGLAAAAETFTFAYLQRDPDPYYAPHRAYTGLALRDRQRPLAGARLAVRESRITGRALGLRFALVERALAPAEDALAALEALVRSDGARVFLLDLPLADVAMLARRLAARDLLLFNPRHADDRLRGEDCSPVLLHTLPSEAMRADALAQFLARNRWREVLVLEGPEDADRRMSAVFGRAARKFGLEIGAIRPFVAGNDPRERERNNLALLTGGIDYDAVFVADSIGEFGRYVPFGTRRPRPVVGSEGLQAAAWHWTWERHGAPQLNQRFERRAGRQMQDSDYAAWAAIRAVVEALTRSRERDPRALREVLENPAFRFDTYKGAPGSFRRWDGQLRQPILLHTHNAVIARAPLQGFLHPRSELDTLGTPAEQTACLTRGDR